MTYAMGLRRIGATYATACMGSELTWSLERCQIWTLLCFQMAGIRIAKDFPVICPRLSSAVGHGRCGRTGPAVLRP